jgi:hypothetical protein
VLNHGVSKMNRRRGVAEMSVLGGMRFCTSHFGNARSKTMGRAEVFVGRFCETPTPAASDTDALQPSGSSYLGGAGAGLGA